MRAVMGGLAAVAMTVSTAVGGTSASAVDSARSEPAWCKPGGEVAAGRLVGKTCRRTDVTVVSGAARVQLPRAGMGVSAFVLTTSGEDTLTVERDSSGVLTVRRGSGAQTRPDTFEVRRQASALTACGSSAFVDLGNQVAGSYDWRYNQRGAPASVAASTLAALRAATNAISGGKDDCGIAGKPAVSNSYLGGTTRSPAVSSTASCTGEADFVNVTAWRALSPPSVLATTCNTIFLSTGNNADSDVAIDTGQSWTTRSAGCGGDYDLTGVMTHERGHTFGLGHPAATTANRGLTMYPTVAKCDFSLRTLGRGDLVGLFRIYGRA